MQGGLMRWSVRIVEAPQTVVSEGLFLLSRTYEERRRDDDASWQEKEQTCDEELSLECHYYLHFFRTWVDYK